MRVLLPLLQHKVGLGEVIGTGLGEDEDSCMWQGELAL